MPQKYLTYQFQDSDEFVDTFDEQPLWSAAFGLMLLDNLEYLPNHTIVDIGSGTGFPLLELAGRLGPSSKCYGLDVWTNANQRARRKANNYGYTNVEIIEGSAEQIPFGDGTIDLIVSNLGINNFERPQIVFAECCRALKHGGKLALTTNINGHWQEFYDCFGRTLKDLGYADLAAKLTDHQQHRGTVESINNMFTAAGFKNITYKQDSIQMRFTDGTALLNHYFVKLGWLGSWVELTGKELAPGVFAQLEHNLNTMAAANGGLSLTVPMLFMQGVKN